MECARLMLGICARCGACIAERYRAAEKEETAITVEEGDTDD